MGLRQYEVADRKNSTGVVVGGGSRSNVGGKGGRGQ